MAIEQNIELLETAYAAYLQDPASVSSDWRLFFEQMDHAAPTPTQTTTSTPQPPTPALTGDIRVYHLIQAYRTFGHLKVHINPIEAHPHAEPRELNLLRLGFTTSELGQNFPTFGILPTTTATLQQIIETLEEIYCTRIGYEYMGLQGAEFERWVQERIEHKDFTTNLSIEEKHLVLQYLNKSELFESFLHTKFVGQKRFSLEGGETLIPILAEIIDEGTKLGSSEFIIGMAHRGRLNVLSNILKKSYRDVFSEFEEGYIPNSFEGSGDVKYHKGFEADIMTDVGTAARVVLTPNPSHLESVYPVVEGQVRARQTLLGDRERKQVIPIAIHGDASIAGQGVVYETMQFVDLKGYATGGTLHIIINNQIGFTTLPRDGRSTRYCTDISKTFNAPVFHVNAEDPESCVYAARLAIEIRQAFHCDVFIDLNCYRKYGHNEGDEPAFTQPLEYQIIRKKRPIREIYRDDLIHQGIVEKEIAEKLEAQFKQDLQEAMSAIKSVKTEKNNNGKSEKKPPAYATDSGIFEAKETGVSLDTLRSLGERLCRIPEGFKIHSKLANLIKERSEMLSTEADARKIDWGMAETLSYATLLDERFSVRLSGQDCCRGTFSHRHAIWKDQEGEQTYFPLQHLSEAQGLFEVYNSPLSEFGVLGFEFGYSISDPQTLTIWEAQFGDFCNGAQIIIDQYIATAQQKWGKKSKLTLLLPHGYEGQGPEHSSARMERFLALAGNENMQIVNPTTPAQLFHLLRRQMLRPVEKPLIVFTPKGLLRHPECTNALSDLTSGSFEEILDDPAPGNKVNTLILCCGRVYYDLVAARKAIGNSDTAIVRIEQLYPLHMAKLQQIVDRYAGFNNCFWVQEEPSNMGAWEFIRPLLSEVMPERQTVKYVGRARSASPAAGSYALHKQELDGIINTLFRHAP
jgi:2-oxoglutarate dehydrogenase E1 component